MENKKVRALISIFETHSLKKNYPIKHSQGFANDAVNKICEQHKPSSRISERSLDEHTEDDSEVPYVSAACSMSSVKDDIRLISDRDEVLVSDKVEEQVSDLQDTDDDADEISPSDLARFMEEVRMENPDLNVKKPTVITQDTVNWPDGTQSEIPEIRLQRESDEDYENEMFEDDTEETFWTAKCTASTAENVNASSRHNDCNNISDMKEDDTELVEPSSSDECCFSSFIDNNIETFEECSGKEQVLLCVAVCPEMPDTNFGMDHEMISENDENIFEECSGGDLLIPTEVKHVNVAALSPEIPEIQIDTPPISVNEQELLSNSENDLKAAADHRKQSQHIFNGQKVLKIIQQIETQGQFLLDKSEDEQPESTPLNTIASQLDLSQPTPENDQEQIRSIQKFTIPDNIDEQFYDIFNRCNDLDTNDIDSKFSQIFEDMFGNNEKDINLCNQIFISII